MSKTINKYIILSLLNIFNITANQDQLGNLKDFKWGAAICEYQNSGFATCKNSNWADWETSGFIENKQNIKDFQLSGKACDFWRLCKDDIKLLKDINLNALRLSVDWSVIEPEEGKFNQEAIDHYVDYCTELVNNNIDPLVTLHHFVHPSWFEKLGAFEKQENIKYFVRFSEKVFQALSPKVSMWCVINEPTIFVFQGYIRGVTPPGKHNLTLGFQVLENLIRAHTEVYKTLKNLENGQSSKIGFIHQYLKFEPYRWWNPIERIPGLFINYALNDVITEYCRTGELKIRVPGIANINYKAPQELNNKVLDYIGLNYYSTVHLKLSLDLSKPIYPACYPDQLMTDMPYAINPEGFYKALVEISKIGVPIYITENGIADSKDDRRSLFIKQYLNSISRAIYNNIDIRGYYYWTLMDNFEWDEGYHMKFGLYSVNYDTQERSLRDGSLAYKKIATKAQNAQNRQEFIKALEN